MASRKSMHPIVDELRNSSPSSSASPLRRRSSVAPQTTAAAPLQENDDEAELRTRRLEKNHPPPGSSTPRNERRSLGLGFVAQMSQPQIAEKVAQCIKMSAENKINTKNAFSLEFIDFMTYMVKKHDANMNNLQMASTSLDVSAKIYGFRVDGVHSDILKMIGAMGRQEEAQRDNAEVPANGEAADGARKKKKRKSKRQIIANVDSLRGRLDTICPSSLMFTNDDCQTTDTLHQASLPLHANSGIYLNPYNDVILDNLDPAAQPNINETKIEARLKNFRDLHICQSFANFEFLGWSADDEIDSSPDKSRQDSLGHHQDDLHFDLDASLPADNEPETNNARDYFDLDDDPDNNEPGTASELCRRVGEQQRLGPNIVDLADVVQATRRIDRPSEYTYFQNNLDIQWDGPSHWKIRYASNRHGRSDVIGNCRQDPVRRRREIILSYENDILGNIEKKFDIAPGNGAKLQAKTAKMHWSEEKLTLPQYVHYDASKFCRSYLRPGVARKFPRKIDHNATHLSDEIGNYDYNNENDTVDYCPNIECNEQEANVDDNQQVDFDEIVGNTATQAFTGDNLVEAPATVNKIFIPYSQRAKKIDMRQLKRTIWKELTVDAVNDDNDNTRKIQDTKAFSDVFKNIPKNLTKSNAEALSFPIAFISLLHLANEKNLTIRGNDKLDDVYVEQDAK